MVGNSAGPVSELCYSSDGGGSSICAMRYNNMSTMSSCPTEQAQLLRLQRRTEWAQTMGALCLGLHSGYNGTWFWVCDLSKIPQNQIRFHSTSLPVCKDNCFQESILIQGRKLFNTLGWIMVTATELEQGLSFGTCKSNILSPKLWVCSMKCKMWIVLKILIMKIPEVSFTYYYAPSWEDPRRLGMILPGINSPGVQMYRRRKKEKRSCKEC